MDIDQYRRWIGRVERRCDFVTAESGSALSATLDRNDPEPVSGSETPPLLHWLCFWPNAPASELDADGHPRRGGFLPPIELPHRTWAGGRLTFLQPICFGDELQRTSRVADVRMRSGRHGDLAFVTVRHEVESARGLVLTEEQDIVFRNRPSPNCAAIPGQFPPARPAFSRTVVPDPVLLFRYSALTFNAHRVHYDRDWATRMAGYPDLVVHSPLVATLLLDLLRRELPEVRVRGFAFKAVRPLFDLQPLTLNGRLAADARSVELWAADHDQFLAMSASAEVG